MIKDIGNKCIECFNDTAYGSGRFPDRLNMSNDKYKGYLCSVCQKKRNEDN